MGKMLILVLDDDLDRHKHFAHNLADHEVIHAQTYERCLQALQNWSPFDLVYLDHDLNDHAVSVGPCTQMYGGLREYDGRDVIRFITNKLPKEKWPKQAIVHSWNDTEGPEMVDMLNKAGIPVAKERYHHLIGLMPFRPGELAER